MPKLLIDGTALSLQPKGVGRYSEHVVRQLTRRLAPDWTIQVLAGADGARTFTGPNSPKFLYVPRLPELIKGLLVLPLLAAAYRIDIVLVPMDVPACSGWRPLISILHDISESIAAAAPRQSSVTQRLIHDLRETFRRSMLRRSAVVVCNSTFVAREAARRYHIPSTSIRIGYCGVDERFYARDATASADWWPAIQQWKGYVLAFATGDMREGYTLYPTICQILRRQTTDIGFVIGGIRRGADYVAALQEDFSCRGLTEGKDYLLLPFLGESEFEKLRALYRDADFYLELSRHEGFGMQLVEAMATGTTCISSGRGALREVGGGFPIELERLDADCVAETLLDCYGQGLDRRDNRAQIEFTRKFDWNSVGQTLAEELVRLYDESRTHDAASAGACRG